MLNEIARSLGALTRSPIQTAIDQAHRQARLFERGGTVPANGADKGYVLPPDIEPIVVAVAIEATLGHNRQWLPRRARLPAALEIRSDGHIAVRAEYLSRLGDDDIQQGRRVLDRIIAEIRLLATFRHEGQR